MPLIEIGRIPPVDHVPDEFQSWTILLASVSELRDTPHDFRTLVIDTGNGAEGLCAAAVCEYQFGGTWADYFAYWRGNERDAKEWARFLALLDDCGSPGRWR